MDETPGQHKTRRSHRKSRYGCTKCKARRIKCDELTPRCSRCKKMGLTCQYPPKKLEDSDCWMELDFSLPDSGTGSAGSPGSPAAGSPLSSASAAAPSPLRSLAAQTLAPAEFELLKHYLEHTSRDLTVEDDDQYTLQIGIPNLACQSKPLMRSVLALAAVCKCRDIISQPSVAHEDRGQVVELLSLANHYHQESLREIQGALHEAKNYDHVLANAAMMGMYGSGSHCTRIWLAKTATFDQPLCDLMPEHPQWMSLFRAVRLAYAGLLNDSTSRTDDTAQLSPASQNLQMRYEYKVSSRVEQSRPPTNHPLGPILATTVGSALARLHEKAAQIQASSSVNSNDNNNNPAALQACLTALTLLSGIVAEAFPPDDSRPNTPPSGNHHHHGGGGNQLAFAVDIDPVGRLSEISPWLRRYTASISSMIPSQLPRRAIMAFVHKAPSRYLNLIDEMLGLFQTTSAEEAPGGGGGGGEGLASSSWGGGCSPVPVPEPSVAHQLAVEIFAHWLVMVILLDNVWWIRGIRAWELGRIVSQVRKDGRWRGCLWNTDRDWWPESMYEISRLFDKHR
ncbi:hypothetical protein C8A00DRAFT_19430 [Chaetomidium leptoderma]|uniref:Zn(2)-C6 fungal-type domain-containing protein n=1 Tax=Chaetomidium leptoderma TaxID=669021 RepID=A0AAN6VCF7_9PEZI|nr:hypothetical protein C8A00DRAFT_19430 [Chaetomidium leptoderma]